MMKLVVKVKPNSKTEKIEKISEHTYKVAVKEPAKYNRANFAVIDVLSEHFSIGRSKVKILKGLTSKTKIIEIYPGHD